MQSMAAASYLPQWVWAGLHPTSLNGSGLDCILPPPMGLGWAASYLPLWVWAGLHPTSPNGSGLDCILPPSMGLALPLIFLHGTPRSPARNVAYTGKTLWVKPTPICSPWHERRIVTSLSFRAFPHGETRVVGRRSSVGGRAYLRSRASRFQLCFHSILYRWKDRFPPVTLLLAVVEK